MLLDMCEIIVGFLGTKGPPLLVRFPVGTHFRKGGEFFLCDPTGASQTHTGKVKVGAKKDSRTKNKKIGAQRCL